MNFGGIDEEQYSSLDSAQILILPVSYEGTVSYGTGTGAGAMAIVDASMMRTRNLVGPSSARLLPSSSSGRGGLRPAGAQQCRPTSAPAMQSRGGSSGRAVSAAGPRASRSWRVAPRAPCAAEALWRRVRTPPAILDEDSADRDANNAAGGIGRGLGRPGRQQRRRRYWTKNGRRGRRSRASRSCRRCHESLGGAAPRT